jgi:Calx-beta domain
MRTVSLALGTGLAVLAVVAAPARAQVIFLQNDSYSGGAVSCYTGVGDEDSIASRFTAAPGQYPYTIDRIRVFGCGGGQDAYVIDIYQDDGGLVAPGTRLWQSQNAYLLDGGNTFNDILMSSEPVPPPPITSGTVRVEIFTISILQPIGFGADTNGIQSHRNFLRIGGAWGYAEDQGVAGDWILRLGILSGSALPAISILDASVPEGNAGTSEGVITVQLSNPSAEQVTVDYATSDGTATAGSDYVSATGSVTFTPGQTVATFPVTILGDGADEADETFTLTLSNPQNATIADGIGQVTITDDDPLPSLSVDDVAVTEGQSGSVNATFTVSLAGLTNRTVTVDYATADGTAQAPGDYTATSGTLIFTPGQTTQPITVAVIGDPAAEPNETFFVNLSLPTNAALADGQGQGTILDDDGASYYTLTPCRVLDTRTSQPLTTGVDRLITIAGSCGVPASAKAVALNIAVTGATARGFVKLFPAGEAAPATSAINYSAGQTRANNGVYGLGAGGAIVGRSGPLAGTAHLILDVYGYFE